MALVARAYFATFVSTPFSERRLRGENGADCSDLALLDGIGEALHDRSEALVAERP